MKILSIFFISIFSGQFVLSQINHPPVGQHFPETISSPNSIVPRPFESSLGTGRFKLRDRMVIYTDDATRETGNYLSEYLRENYQLNLAVQPRHASTGAGILLSAVRPLSGVSTENYSLSIREGSVMITGGEAGVFYGVQSLLQLVEKANGILTIPCMTIRDKPRFRWRGLSLDVSRHFFSVETVKKYIDLMAHYKFNTFHWHLTDDEGWRIQIDKYPELTTKGSFMNRWAAEGKFRALSNITGGGNEGYYTKDQVREIVAYAHRHYIIVVPEIEMPGHSEAAIFAYPELGVQDSTGETIRQKPVPRVGMYDPSEKVFSFLRDVLTEVMELFPDKYIHIGGDEADMEKWLKSPIACTVMKEQGLKNVKEVQSYFIKRMEKFIVSKGRQLVGWDEILEGGVAPTATVMSWRGEEGGITAAKMHHPVVMTPLPYVYFDAPQSDDPSEPIGWNDPLSWQHVYGYEPVPASLSITEGNYVLGAQGNIWAEKIPTAEHLEYMVYPRALALAEACWTAKGLKDLSDFTRRLDHQFALLHVWNVNARLPDAEGLPFVSTNRKDFLLKLSHPLKDAQIRYTLDGSLPDEKSPLYRTPVMIDLSGHPSLIIKTRTSSSLSSQLRYQTILLTYVPVEIFREKNSLADSGFNGASTVFFSGLEYNIASSGMLAGASGICSSVRIPQKDLPAGFREIRFTGYLQIIRESDYRLGVSSDGETVLTVDGKMVIDNRGYRGTVERESLLHLKKGYYPIDLWYKNEEDAKMLDLKIRPVDGKPMLLSGILLHAAGDK
ncbi:family 20 glycosylhydrolase [Flavitalea flava]